MLTFSSELEATLRRMLAIAAERRHEQAMRNHLLLALTEDPDAAAVMRGCAVDIEQLRRALDASLSNSTAAPIAKGEVDPTSAAEVQEVIQNAVVHIREVGREVVTGAHVLVALLELWPGSLLQQQGMTRYHAVSFLTHGSMAPAAPPMPDAGETATGLFDVLMLNDDYTPMEFVVHVLERVFEWDRQGAGALMMHVHSNGEGVCGSYPQDTAMTKAKQVMDFAREHQHPLRCRVRASALTRRA
jgi:ATP-dependent Clp protease adapter protein ClpS